jgi:hypothetical protein
VDSDNELPLELPDPDPLELLEPFELLELELLELFELLELLELEELLELDRELLELELEPGLLLELELLLEPLFELDPPEPELLELGVELLELELLLGVELLLEELGLELAPLAPAPLVNDPLSVSGAVGLPPQPTSAPAPVSNKAPPDSSSKNSRRPLGWGVLVASGTSSFCFFISSSRYRVNFGSGTAPRRRRSTSQSAESLHPP